MGYQSKPLYLLKPANHTPRLQKAIDSFLEEWLSEHELPDDTPLFHYTDLTGLQGILQNRSLWCGHSSTLNDPLEIQYGQEVVGPILRDRMETEDREDIRAFYRNILVQVQAFSKRIFHTFLACFCGSGNLLSQWRAYADRGGGYCVGFEFTEDTATSPDLTHLQKERPLYLRKVIYDKSRQERLVEEYLDLIVPAAKAALDGNISAQFPDNPTYPAAVMAMQAANVVLDMLLCFKHEAFESEEEWRLVQAMVGTHQPEGLQFREMGSRLIPYRPIHIFNVGKDGPTFPLHSVGFGPMLEPSRTRSALDLLLQHTAADDHPIRIVPHEVQIRGAGYSLR